MSNFNEFTETAETSPRAAKKSPSEPSIRDRADGDQPLQPTSTTSVSSGEVDTSAWIDSAILAGGEVSEIPPNEADFFKVFFASADI